MVATRNVDSPDARNSLGTNVTSNQKYSINEYGIRSFDSDNMSGYCFKTYNSNMDPSLLAEMPKNSGPQSTDHIKGSNIYELKKANVSPILNDNKTHTMSHNEAQEEPVMMRSNPTVGDTQKRLKSKFKSIDE